MVFSVSKKKEAQNMSSEIAVCEFRALADGAEAAALLETNLGGESLRYSDLTFVKIPTGGATTWSWSSPSGRDFSSKTIRGVLVVVGKTTQTLWPHADATTGSKPLLVSRDGKVAHKVGSDYGDLDANIIEAAKRDDGLYDVSKIPYFHWQGSGPGAKPPRAKSSRVIGVLREEDGLPVFIRISQTSLRVVDTLLRGLTAEGIFHYRAIVELSLEKRKGQRADYAVLVAKAVGDIGPEFGEKAREKFTVPLTPVVDPEISASRIVTALASDEVPF